MNVILQNNHPNCNLITYEYCRKAHRTYLRENGNDPFFISGWDVNRLVATPINLLERTIPQIKENINKYYLIEEDIGKSDIVQYLCKHNTLVSHDQVLVADSATSLISLAILALTTNLNNVLVLEPAYFATHDSLSLIGNKFISIAVNSDTFTYDCNKIENVLRKSHIGTIIWTDPIFGTGVPLKEENLMDLILLANKYDCTVIVDMARFGLSWLGDYEQLLGERLAALQKAEHYAVVYSPCKKIFANGIKTGVLIASLDVMKILLPYSDSIIGSVSAAQIEFLKVLLSSDSKKYIQNQVKNNINLIKSQYGIVKSLTLVSNIRVVEPKMGHFALVDIPLERMSKQTVFHRILDEANTLTLPMDIYGLTDDSRYLFRLNLLEEIEHLATSLLSISSILENN